MCFLDQAYVFSSFCFVFIAGHTSEHNVGGQGSSTIAAVSLCFLISCSTGRMVRRFIWSSGPRKRRGNDQNGGSGRIKFLVTDKRILLQCQAVNERDAEEELEKSRIWGHAGRGNRAGWSTPSVLESRWTALRKWILSKWNSFLLCVCGCVWLNNYVGMCVCSKGGGLTSVRNKYRSTCFYQEMGCLFGN